MSMTLTKIDQALEDWDAKIAAATENLLGVRVADYSSGIKWLGNFVFADGYAKAMRLSATINECPGDTCTPKQTSLWRRDGGSFIGSGCFNNEWACASANVTNAGAKYQ